MINEDTGEKFRLVDASKPAVSTDSQVDENGFSRIVSTTWVPITYKYATLILEDKDEDAPDAPIDLDTCSKGTVSKEFLDKLQRLREVADPYDTLEIVDD